MIVLLIKGKLFQTENFMPFFSALVKYTNKKFIIIYPTKIDYNEIKKNKDIFLALKALGKIKFFYSTFDLDQKFIYGKRKGFWYSLLGLLSVLHRNLVLFPLLFKKSIIFGNEKLPFIEWILNFNKFFLKGKRISLLIYPYDLEMFKNEIIRVLSAKKDYMPFKKVIEYNSNILISSYPRNEIKKLSPKIYKKYKIFDIGHKLYNWPTWINLLENVSKDEVSFLKKSNYIFFPLAILKRKMLTPNGYVDINFSNTILFLVNSISRIDKNILIIFRPHPTSDLEQIRNIIKKSKHKNFLISYTNSTFLIKYSKFIIKYGISLMDPKAIYYNKVCLRFHPKSSIAAIKEELKNNKYNEKLKIFDITNKKILEKMVKKIMLSNRRNYQEKRSIIKEAVILQDILNHIK